MFVLKVKAQGLKDQAFQVGTLREAAQRYIEYRDRLEREMGFDGASEIAQGRVLKAGKIVAFVSYNGRLWDRSTGDNAAQEIIPE